jgi:hypothetical protein
MAAFGILGFLVFIAVAIIQTAVGYIGIEHHFGTFDRQLSHNRLYVKNGIAQFASCYIRWPNP